jgi:hypothetical protein
MAIANVNMNASPNGYLGYGQTNIGVSPQSPSAGQIVEVGTSGPLAKTLTGIATATGDGSSSSFTLNFIDGVNKIGQIPVIVALQSVTAGATINGVANQSQYSGVGAFGQLRVGNSVTIAGFSNAANNGTFTVTKVTSSYVQVTNAGPSVAETNYAATLSFVYGPAVAAVRAFRVGTGFTGVSDTGAATISIASITAITNIGCTVTLSATSAAATYSFVFDVLFAS